MWKPSWRFRRHNPGDVCRGGREQRHWTVFTKVSTDCEHQSNHILTYVLQIKVLWQHWSSSRRICIWEWGVVMITRERIISEWELRPRINISSSQYITSSHNLYFPVNICISTWDTGPSPPSPITHHNRPTSLLSTHVWPTSGLQHQCINKSWAPSEFTRNFKQ